MDTPQHSHIAALLGLPSLIDEPLVENQKIRKLSFGVKKHFLNFHFARDCDLVLALGPRNAITAYTVPASWRREWRGWGNRRDFDHLATWHDAATQLCPQYMTSANCQQCDTNDFMLMWPQSLDSYRR